MGYLFTEADSDYLYTDDGPPDFTGDYTIVWWMAPAKTANWDGIGIIHIYSNYSGYEFDWANVVFNNGTYYSIDVRARFEGGTEDDGDTSAYSFPNGVPAKCSLVRDGSTLTFTATAISGETASVSCTLTNYASRGSPARCYLAHNNNWGDYFNGELHNFKAFGRALTAGEIASEHNSMLPVHATDLTWWLPMIDGVDLTTDLAGRSAWTESGSAVVGTDSFPVAWSGLDIGRAQSPVSGGAQSVTPTTETLTVTPYAPTVSTPVAVTPTTETLTITTYAPGVYLAWNGTPGTAALTVTPYAPTVEATGDVEVTPTTEVLTATAYAPTVTASDHIAVTPTTVALTATPYAPTVTATENISVTPTTTAITATPYAPTVTASDLIEVTPTTVALTATPYAPTVTTTDNIAVTPTNEVLTVTPFAPTVVASSSVNVTPTTEVVTVTTYVPTVTATLAVTPTTETVTLTGYAPSVHTGVYAAPTFGELVVATFTPTVASSAAVAETTADEVSSTASYSVPIYFHPGDEWVATLEGPSADTPQARIVIHFT